MTVSPAIAPLAVAPRTIILPPPTFGPPSSWWAEVGELLDYRLDITGVLFNPNDETPDTIDAVSVAMSPGSPQPVESRPVSVSAEAGVITVWIAASGFPGRVSKTELEVTTTNGRTFVFVVAFRVSADLAWELPLPTAPNQNFGVPIEWQRATLDFASAGNSMFLAVV